MAPGVDGTWQFAVVGVSPSPRTAHLLVLAGGLAVTLASLVWAWRNRDHHAVPEYALFLVAVGLWATAQALEVVGGPAVARTASFAVEAFRALVSVGWFYFAATYAGYRRVVHSPAVRLAVAAAVLYLLVFTAFPPVATEFTFDAVRVSTTPFTAVALAGDTPFHDLARFVGYLLVGVGTLVLLYRLLATEYAKPWRTLLVLAAVFTTVAFDLSFDEVLVPAPGVDYTALGVSVVSGLFVLALYRGEVIGFVPVARDHVFQNMDDGVVVADRDGTVVDINPAARSVFGDALQVGDDVGTVLGEVATPGDGATPTDEHTTLTRTRDGGTRHYDVHVSSVESPAEGGIAVTLRDVTDRVTNREQLRRTRDRMEFALTATDAFVWDLHVGTGEISCYPTEKPVLGTSVETLDEFIDVVHPDDRARVREAIQRSFESGEPDREEFRIRRDGEPRWLVAPGKPVGDDSQRMIGVSRDVTDRKRSERELQRQNDRLERFASLLSHDLRNPLNVASGRLALLREECDSEHLDVIERNHERMAELIEDVLTLAREGESVGETERVDLASVARDGWQTVATEEATLVTETDQSVLADRGGLQRLLENLFRNAVEHAGEDVTVTVTGLEEETGFAVVDDGPGFPDGECGDVFELGYSTARDGTGFGLAIVRELARAHGWQARATEGRDGGARFEFVTG